MQHLGSVPIVKKDALEREIYDERELTPDERISILERKLENKDKIIENLKKSRYTEIRRGEYEERITKIGEDGEERRVIDKTKRNLAKVTLARIGKVQFYCYPYSSLNKIYMGFGSQGIELTKYDLPKILGAYNKGRWFVENAKNVLNGKLESQSELAQQIRLAFNYALEKEMIEEKIIRKQKKIEMFEALENMKPVIREKWFGDEEGLEKEFNEWQKEKYQSK